VVVSVSIPAEREALTIEHEQDLHHNVQETRVITGSLCAQEFNKVWNIQIAKVIWDTLKEAHEGTEHVRQGKMDVINGELDLFFMKDGETVREIYDRLMVLVLDIRALGSKDWDDSKVTKKLLRAFAPKDKNLTSMIRRDPRYPIMTPNQLLGEILHQELVDQDVEKSLTLKMNNSLALNASSSEVVEEKPKTSKTKKEDTSDEGSTDEETAFAIRKYKKFLKSKASRKGGDERKKSQRKCYECGEYGHFIAECPKNKNKNEEEKKYKEKSKEYKNKYHCTKGVLTWVNNGTQVMKMRNQRNEAWKPSPWHKSHLHHTSSTTSPMMRTTLTFASWQGGQGTRNYHLILSNLSFIHT
jgi:hypothetical protein